MRFARSRRALLALAASMLLALVATTAQSPAQTPTIAQKSGTVPNASARQVDINTARLDELKTLPGIGDAYAQKIINGRPYSNKTQLQSRGILPGATYNKIADLIIAKRVTSPNVSPNVASPKPR